MKINTFVTLATVLLVVVYLFVMRIGEEEEVAMASLVPGSALLYFEQSNGVELLKRLDASLLAEKVRSIDLPKLREQIPELEKGVSILGQMKEMYNTLLEDAFVDEMAGKRFAYALLEPAEDVEYNDLEEFFRQNSLIVCEPVHSAGMLEFFADTYVAHEEELPVSIAQYGNHHIRRIDYGQERIGVVRVHGFFLVSLNERLLRKCLDMIDSNKLLLSDDIHFTTVRKKFQTPQSYLYFCIESWRNYMQDFLHEGQVGWKDISIGNLKDAQGFNGVGVAVDFFDDKISEKIVVSYDKRNTTALVQNYLKTAPGKNSMLKFSTREPVAYYWSNVFNFAQLLPLVKNESQGHPQFKEFAVDFKEQSGMSLEDFLGKLDGEVSLSVHPGVPDSFLAIPQLLVVLKVKSPKKIKDVFLGMAKAYNLNLKSRIYREARCWYWANAPQEGLRPLFGYQGNYFFVSNSLKLFQTAVMDGKKNFEYNRNRMMDLGPGLQQKNNSATCFNNVGMLGMAQQILELLGTVVALEDKEISNKGKIFIKEFIDPILDGFKMLEKSCTRSYFTADTIVIDSVSRISLN